MKRLIASLALVAFLAGCSGMSGQEQRTLSGGALCCNKN